jgi:uncharacterized membrane protein YcaP (DUF421 family)
MLPDKQMALFGMKPLHFAKLNKGGADMSIFIETCARALSAIAVLFALARLMGKRQISQLTFFDYVAGISIGSIAASMAVDPTIGYIRGLSGMLVFTLFTVLLYIASLKSYGLRKLLEGKPIVVIQDGTILEKNLKKTRLTVNDLLEECRLKNAFIIADIAYAILETKGELSILMKPQRQPLTPQDMNLQVSGSGVVCAQTSSWTARCSGAILRRFTWTRPGCWRN